MQISIRKSFPNQRDKVGTDCLTFINPNYTAPLEKIIATDNLSYIPNLYFRKYKLIEALNHQRFDFPEQKILLARPKTSWDALLCQVKEKAQLRKEIQKYKIAQNYHVATTAKDEFIKKELKKQQRQLFHRIFANQLSEEVQNYFKAHTTVALQQTNGQCEKNGQTQLKKSDSMNRGRGMDDIFIDNKPDQDYLGVDNGGDIDFFDDILNDGIQNKTPLDLINEPSKLQQTAPQRTVKDYVDSYNKMLEASLTNQMQEEIADPVPSHVSRKSCLKRINQNIRRRLKTKGAQEEDRSLASATVALSHLINHYPECREIQNFVQIPRETQWIFDDIVKNKKKRDEDFVLNWDQQEIQKFEELNEKFQFSKLKDAQSVLQITVQKSEFPKLFERNIATNFNFPSNIASIKSFTSRFNQKKFYYNEFFDSEYERFVRKNNKRKLLEKFEKNSNYMFAQHYVQDEIGNDERVSIGKMFLHSQSKISDRLIYKVTPGTSKISIVAKDYNRKNVPISREKIILLSYLVNRYLTEFGNNWKTITQFIEIFPCFSNYIIRPELVQEFYQIINRHELKVSHLENLEIWDKKMLPSNQIYSGSYQDFSKIARERAQSKKSTKDNKMTDEPVNTADELSDEANDFQLDNYESFLKESLKQKSQKKSIFQNLSSKYKNYGQTLRAQTTNETYNFYQNKIRKVNKIIEEYRNTYGVTKVDGSEMTQNQEIVVQYVKEYMKGDVKNGLPFRKKKNINERNNELVKILQALRSKNTTNMQPQGSQKMPVDMSKQTQSSQPKPTMMQPQTNPQMTPIPPVQASTPKPADASQAEKQQKKSKTPQKRVSGAGNINKKPKKKQGEEDKEKK